MSKTRKSRKVQFDRENKYGYEEEEDVNFSSNADKRKARRFERALKTRNVYDLIDEDLDLREVGDYE